MSSDTTLEIRGVQPPLVGRLRELAQIWSLYERASQGHANVVLVAGEPGIGKTRLLDGVAARAAAAGAMVLRGGASSAEGMPPYLPFLEALGRHIRSEPLDRLREQTSHGPAILAALFPELVRRFGELPPPYSLPPEQARLRLYEAIGEFVAAMAAVSPLVLIFDDLQWADPASLDLLSYVARHQSRAPLLILGAYREGEAAHNRPLKESITELTRHRQLTTITVGPLSADEVRALAERYLDSVDLQVSDRLYRHSEGNPFFAEELLHGWVESGVLKLDGERWRWVLPSEDTTLSLPPTIVAAVGQRLSRLAPQIVELLRTASIIGRSFEATLLARVIGQEVEQVEEQLQEAVRVRLLRLHREGAYAFSHDKIRESLYVDVTSARRTRLHGLIGKALEAYIGEPELGFAQEGAQQLASLAFHFTHSGDRQRGLKYAQQAAQQASRAYAYEEAMGHYRTALTLAGVEDPERGEMLMGLGEAALMADAEHDAIGAFQAARAWFLQVGKAIEAAHAAHGLGRARWRLEEWPQARAAFEEALTLLGDRRCPEAVRVLVDLATMLAASMGQHAEAMTYGQRALEMARYLGDDWLEAAANRTVGNLMVRGGDLRSGVSLLEKALELATSADDPAEAAECCAFLANAYLWLGRVRASIAITFRRLDFAKRCNDPYQFRHIYSWLGTLYSMLGEFTKADQMMAQARPAVERLASPEPLAFLFMTGGLLSYQRGDYASAEQLYQKAIETFRKMGPSTLVWYLGMLGMAQASLNKWKEAIACMDELEELVARLPATSMEALEALTTSGITAATVGDKERITRLYPRLLVFKGLHMAFLTDRALGMMATTNEEWQTASEHLSAAEALARSEGLRPELITTLIAQADLELAKGGRGSTQRARDLLNQALALCEDLEMTSEVVRLRERGRNLADQSSAQSRRSPLPAGLSPREAEVLRLVAAGKSNRRIAEELSISERTVENHLASIFYKTGADNRAAAAAFAIRHKLA